jgi:hypothetical protein
MIACRLGNSETLSQQNKTDNNNKKEADTEQCILYYIMHIKFNCLPSLIPSIDAMTMIFFEERDSS